MVDKAALSDFDAMSEGSVVSKGGRSTAFSRGALRSLVSDKKAAKQFKTMTMDKIPASGN